MVLPSPAHIFTSTIPARTFNGPNPGAGSIGEYNLDGSVVNAALISGMDDPIDLAILGNNLFVLDHANKSIGEYDATSGATINSHLVTGLSDPFGIAVVPEPSSLILCILTTLLFPTCSKRLRQGIGSVSPPLVVSSRWFNDTKSHCRRASPRSSPVFLARSSSAMRPPQAVVA